MSVPNSFKSDGRKMLSVIAVLTIALAAIWFFMGRAGQLSTRAGMGHDEVNGMTAQTYEDADRALRAAEMARMIADRNEPTPHESAAAEADAAAAAAAAEENDVPDTDADGRIRIR